MSVVLLRSILLKNGIVISLNHNGNIYNLQLNADGYKKGLYSFYMPSFVCAINLIEFICGLIVKDKKVNNFNLLDSKHFFK